MDEFIKKASSHISNSRSDIHVAIKEGLKMLYDDLKKEESYIGKTDINNKKIYAGRSIVEFEFTKDRFTPKRKAIGYYTYNSLELSFMIKLLDDKNEENYLYRFTGATKIIDTIQENKLGLYGDKK